MVTKYRYKILTGEFAERVRKLVRETCEAFEIRIVKGVVSKDHVHILVSCPPTVGRPLRAAVGRHRILQRQFRTSSFFAFEACQRTPESLTERRHLNATTLARK